MSTPVLVQCAITLYRLISLRGEAEEMFDEFGVFFPSHDPDVQKMEEYLVMALSQQPTDSRTLCLYAQFLEKKRDFVAAEGVPYLVHSIFYIS
jgi:hypothetical protein